MKISFSLDLCLSHLFYKSVSSSSKMYWRIIFASNGSIRHAAFSCCVYDPLSLVHQIFFRSDRSRLRHLHCIKSKAWSVAIFGRKSSDDFSQVTLVQIKVWLEGHLRLPIYLEWFLSSKYFNCAQCSGSKQVSNSQNLLIRCKSFRKMISVKTPIWCSANYQLLTRKLVEKIVGRNQPTSFKRTRCD